MKIQIACLIILVFAGAIFAQSIKTDAARQLADVNAQIAGTESAIETAKSSIAKLQPEFHSESVEIREANNELKSLNALLVSLKIRRTVLLKLPLKMSLPTTDRALLKLLVMQNEKIIDLLEELARIR